MLEFLHLPGRHTSRFHAFVERLHFCTLDDYSNYFTGKVNVGVIFTMNAPQAYYQLQYRKKLAEQAACQASRRGGTLSCRREGSKSILAGKAALYSIDELFL